MMHQYIGARYVPIFYVNSQDPDSSEWENNVEYEPLVWVSLPNGNMYLSKKTVPALIGSPASNPEYWMTAGQFNAYIQSIQNQINDMNDGDVPGSLQNQINDNDSDIAALTDRIDRRYVFIADSYGEGVGATPADGWTNQVKNMLGLDADHYYISQLGGSGFVGNVATTFIDLLETAGANVTDPDTITDVVCIGGYNDIGKSNVATAVYDFCNRAIALFPNAVVTIGMCGYDTNGSHGNIRKAIPAILSDYSSAIISRTRFVDDLYYALKRSVGVMSADGIHPNATGYLVLSKCILSAILGGSGYSHFRDWITTTFVDITNHTKSFNVVMNEEMTTLAFPFDLAFVTLDLNKPTANSWFKLGSLTTNNILHGAATQASDNAYYGASGEAIVNLTSGGGYVTVDAILGVYNDELYINLIGVDPLTHSYYDYTNATQISLQGIWKFDSMYV